MKPVPRPRSCRALTALALVMTTGHASMAADAETGAASKLPERRGFFMRGLLDVSPTFIDSRASLVSGFQQPLPSTATALGFGAGIELGSSIAPGWVLAGMLDYRTFQDVRVDVGGQSVKMKGLVLNQLTMTAGVTYIPWRDTGWYATARIGWSGLEVGSGSDAVHASTPLVRGPLGSITLGHEWWIGSKVWLGAAARCTRAYLSDEGHARTTQTTPGLLATVTWF